LMSCILVNCVILWFVEALNVDELVITEPIYVDELCCC